MRDLDDALTALSDRQPEKALGALLKTWRATHEPRVAAAIEQLSERLLVGRPPPFDSKAKNPRQEWLKLAASRTDATVPWLLNTLGHPRDDVTEERIVAMTTWAPDPRLARAATRRLHEISGKDGRRNGPRLLALLAAMGDARFVDELGPLVKAQSRLGRSIGAQVRATIAALKRVGVVALPPAQLEALDQALGAVPSSAPRSADLDALMAAVYATPASDEPRLVLADALQEQGFPRGEFIALQVARAASGAPASARETKLFKRWSDEWLEPYAPHFYGSLREAPDFARGFLRSATFRATDERPPSPAWRTIEALELVNGDDEDAPRDQLASETFASLREVSRIPIDWLDACAARAPLPWKRVDTIGTAKALKAMSRRAARLALENLLVLLDDDRDLPAAAKVLFSSAWDHVATRTLSGQADLSLTEDRVTATLQGSAESMRSAVPDLVSALGAVPSARLKTLLVQGPGTIEKHELWVDRGRIDLSPLAAFAQKRGLPVLFRRLSEWKGEPLHVEPITLGAEFFGPRRRR